MRSNTLIFEEHSCQSYSHLWIATIHVISEAHYIHHSTALFCRTLTSRLDVLGTRVLGEDRWVESLELRASKGRGVRSQILAQERGDGIDRLSEWLTGIGETLLRGLKHEAGEVVALEKSLAVVDATGEVTKVDTDEGVGLASVASEADDTWVHLVVDHSVDVGVGSVHWLESWSLVPG